MTIINFLHIFLFLIIGLTIDVTLNLLDRKFRYYVADEIGVHIVCIICWPVFFAIYIIVGFGRLATYLIKTVTTTKETEK